MATNTLKTRIKHKYGTPAEWAQATNFSPLQGELVVYDGEVPKIKIGDGETNVEALPFITDECITVDLDNTEAGVIPKTNANQLGGIDAEQYATKAYVSAEIDNMDLSDFMLKTDIAINSEKLGGKAPEYYLQPRNLLDNSDFTNPVNQRGITMLTPTEHSYTIDRWRMDKEKTFTLNDGSITINGAWFVQFIGTKIDNTKTYTMAACLEDGTIVAETGVPSSKTRGTYFGFDYSSAMDRVYVGIIKAGTYKWAALYEGTYTADTLPPYVPKGYAAELLECQRYYYKFQNGTNVYGYTGSSGTSVYIAFELPTTMRLTNPTVSMSGNIYGAFGGAGATSLTSISSSKTMGKQIELVMSLPGSLSANTVYAGWVNGTITVSADL